MPKNRKSRICIFSQSRNTDIIGLPVGIKSITISYNNRLKPVRCRFKNCAKRRRIKWQSTILRWHRPCRSPCFGPLFSQL